MLYTKVIGLLVSKKKILKVFTIYGPGSHLGYVSRNIWFQTALCFFRKRNLKMLNLN